MSSMINTTYDLLYVIINQGLGSKVLHKAKEVGLHGGTIYYAIGTVKNPILNFLALYDEHKEVVLMGGNETTIDQAIIHLNKTFKFYKPNHGIMYRINSCRMLGSRFNDCIEHINEKEGESMYHIITTIVDKGKGEDVVNASKEAGARGGTIINARGSGVNETSKVFNMEIEPEKEIVVIIVKQEESESIVNNIRVELKLDEPGQGIIFVQEAAEVHGLFHQGK
jgi:nitrogen regulatory protein PII